MTKSKDIQRLVDLQTTAHSPDQAGSNLVREFTDLLARSTGDMKLFPWQAYSLWQALDFEPVGGLFAALGVGHGKSLIAALLPTLIGAERPAILVPNDTIDEFVSLLSEYNGHWHIRDDLQVIKYSTLSQKKHATLLDDLEPDLVVADEAHLLGDTSSVRTGRVIRYFDDHRDARFCALSGTFLRRSLDDLYHLVELALRDRTPLPLNWQHQQALRRTTDVEGGRDWPKRVDWKRVEPVVQEFGDLDSSARLLDKPVETRRDLTREAVRRRLSSAPGVALTRESSSDADLTVYRLVEPEPPEIVTEAVNHVSGYWELPGDDGELMTAMHAVEAERQLLQGFYYRFDWPNDTPDIQWLEARRGWRQAARDVCKYRIPELDSPGLLRQAIENGTLDEYATTQARERDLARAERAWQRWDSQREKPEPPRKAVWLSKWLIDAAALWAEHGPPSLIWWRHKAVAEALEDTGVDVCWPGSEREPADVDGEASLAVSMNSHSKGLNLQAWQWNVVLVPPPVGDPWEQLLGRTHREGQQADEVRCAVFTAPERWVKDLEKAREYARYVQQMNGQRQKLVLAEYEEAELDPPMTRRTDNE